MKHFAFAITLGIAALAAAYSTAGVAAEPAPAAATAASARWTFDGGIHNNSLAVSPDEQTAVVSYTERPDVRTLHDINCGAAHLGGGPGAALVQLGLGAEGPADEIVGGPQHLAQQLHGTILIAGLGGERATDEEAEAIGDVLDHERI